ncbi:MAG: ABC transporter ATP-binding protein [Alkalispirochaeta sp.]
MALVTVENVTKDYALGKTTIHALRGISLEIERGEFVAIAGPSGCGKTTLLNLIGCIDRPTAGTVTVNDTDVSRLDDVAESRLRLEHIGFVFQSFNLIPVLTVRENVEFPTILAKTPKEERREYVEYLLDAVGIAEYAHHRPDELSGGQRQRVAVARALVNHPSLVIADEPTANLDSETGDRIIALMRDLNARDKVTFLFSTHNPEILNYANRTIRLRDGLVDDHPADDPPPTPSREHDAPDGRAT